MGTVHFFGHLMVLLVSPEQTRAPTIGCFYSMGGFLAFAMDNSFLFKKFLEFDSKKDYYNEKIMLWVLVHQ